MRGATKPKCRKQCQLNPIITTKIKIRAYQNVIRSIFSSQNMSLQGGI